MGWQEPVTNSSESVWYGFVITITHLNSDKLQLLQEGHTCGEGEFRGLQVQISKTLNFPLSQVLEGNSDRN